MMQLMLSSQRKEVTDFFEVIDDCKRKILTFPAVRQTPELSVAEGSSMSSISKATEVKPTTAVSSASVKLKKEILKIMFAGVVRNT